MSLLCFCKVQYFFVKIHVWEREELDTSPLSFEFSQYLKDRIKINIVCYTTKFFSALVSLVCFHINAARINIVILALHICSRFRNQILESVLS